MRIVIAEDQGMLRGALSALLSLEDDIEVVGQAENGQKALELIQSLKPDLCIMDIEMPELSGLDVAEQVNKLKLPVRVVILTTFARTGYFQRATRAGIHGYLLKDSPIDDLTSSLRTIMNGGKVVAPELALSLWVEDNPLSEREQSVLLMIAEGKSSQEIAKELFLTNGTVRNYTSEIMQKLNAKNRIDAISIAQSKGWLG
ncbi:response regulator transcription factor [Paenibacillus albiflavus]|uniref:Response regulator transcription factor n=1 Tax=Paenibacillus albiflavus TaxID=2545760 RepID=A0A4V2WNE2_9BACL|nr:response regulator transcription factor [Paenibacillus albiflavus]TCZ75142.1 response regulator transcription factor [Paenibacillus albiflavus]